MKRILVLVGLCVLVSPTTGRASIILTFTETLETVVMRPSQAARDLIQELHLPLDLCALAPGGAVLRSAVSWRES